MTDGVGKMRRNPARVHPRATVDCSFSLGSFVHHDRLLLSGCLHGRVSLPNIICNNSGHGSNTTFVFHSTQKNTLQITFVSKIRRAHLRNCLEILKEIVPLGPEASRHTTLGLLTKAKRFIKNLEDKERKHSTHKEQLNREHRFLRRRLEQLSQSYALSKRRSLSECSSSTVSSNHSTASLSSAPSPISESDEVDVIGYTSTQSDTDDHSSVQSASSDSGVTMSTSRLTLSEMDVMDVL
ncbi:max-interacting protein 1-like isoform X2 [Tenebrio molitor]|uniref:max-interacting protein 1-like isoform X2 n=1 Tax=Tenebrio molitor TaxID=7067 RepID=UPI003624780D